MVLCLDGVSGFFCDAFKRDDQFELGTQNVAGSHVIKRAFAVDL
jgi:hypothetical protein